MEVEYKREMNRNYMILRPEPRRMDRYTIRMLSGNLISGLLPFQEKWINGENRYYYDITSKQPLARFMEFRTMSGEEIQSFVAGFLSAMKQLERFLLDENQICLNPEYIYVAPETFQCTLLMIPGRYGDFIHEFQELCQYLLDHVNQNDGDAVILAFSIFKESQKKNFGMEDIERCLQEAKKRTHIPEAADEEPKPVVQVEEYEEWRTEVTESENILFGMDDSEGNDVRDTKRWKKTVLVLFFAAMFLLPLITLFIGGLSLLLRYKVYLLGGEVLFICGIILLREPEKNMHRQHLEVADDNVFEHPEEVFMEKEQVWKKEPDAVLLEEQLKTVLLTAKPVGGTSRFLVPVGGGEEIPVSYFPFLIGKNKDIVDFYLNEPGISRLHAKLEECDGQYYITDLNSTNGIMVDGAWLETNEKRLLSVGSEVILAASRFYFR